MNPRLRATSTVLVLLAAGCLALSAPCRSRSVDEARTEAAATGRLVLVDASAEWCGPCKRFLAARESSRKLQSALAHHAFVVVSDETPAGERELARLHVRGFPTFILLTAQGEEIERWSGFGAVNDFVRRLAAAAADPTTLAAKRARFDAEPTADLARRIGDTLAARSEHVDAIGYYDRAAELEPRGARGIAWNRHYAVSAAVHSGDLGYADLMDAGERLVAAFPASSKAARNAARSVARGLAHSIPEGFDRSRIRPAIERALGTYASKPSAEEQAERDLLSAALLPPRSLDERLAELDAKPSINGTFALLSDLQAAGRHADAVRIAQRTPDLEPTHAGQFSMIALSVVAEGVREGGVDAAELEAAARRAVEAGDGTDDRRLDVVREVARALAGGQDAELLRAQVEAGLALTEGAAPGDARASVRAELLALEAAVLEKDGATALSLMGESLGAGWEEDPSQVLDLAEFLLDCGVELPEAERLAREALSTSSERGLRKRASLDLARALRAQGRRDEAIVVLDDALKASPHDVRLTAALAAD